MSNAPRRLLCPRCDRPQSACICAWITPTANEARVLILQHPLEVKQAKGSARLLQLSLQHTELRVGETFDPDELQTWLAADGGGASQTVLLYPAHPELPAPGADMSTLHPSQIKLVVLDGTWRKSLKMLHIHPALQALPRLALSPDAPSRYLIRKAHRPDQLSTLEATCMALAELEQSPERYTPLLTAFSSFVSDQLRHTPRA
ncbi:MAG TPA: tRNA-uridine aminocarboxypropyltransferase [Aquabacterium sp.]|uniref:tRNA-uridine aminocarboxypropyltransferase n=1 Tax=Aquabacterium sp. TaxID=1872578 RepID=UPI002E35E6AC|nr:tRNA-uridine aminocarboxypropyltransferase [Aquabacterium sp.]HEX5356075.1 tRNA-uridine aminocarboxypropyltransferase [Aquabacterium sp.]